MAHFRAEFSKVGFVLVEQHNTRRLSTWTSNYTKDSWRSVPFSFLENRD